MAKERSRARTCRARDVKNFWCASAPFYKRERSNFLYLSEDCARERCAHSQENPARRYFWVLFTNILFCQFKRGGAAFLCAEKFFPRIKGAPSPLLNWPNKRLMLVQYALIHLWSVRLFLNILSVYRFSVSVWKPQPKAKVTNRNRFKIFLQPKPTNRNRKSIDTEYSSHMMHS